MDIASTIFTIFLRTSARPEVLFYCFYFWIGEGEHFLEGKNYMEWSYLWLDLERESPISWAFVVINLLFAVAPSFIRFAVWCLGGSRLVSFLTFYSLDSLIEWLGGLTFRLYDVSWWSYLLLLLLSAWLLFPLISTATSWILKNLQCYNLCLYWD